MRFTCPSSYSTRRYPNPFFSSISLINNNILYSTSLIVFLNRNYFFSNPELASCTAAKFSCFLNSGQQSLFPQWPEPWHAQQGPWYESMIPLSFSSFLGLVSGLYHVPDHLTSLKAVGFLSFPLKPSLVAVEPPLVAEFSLVTKPCELDLWKNFEEDCCCCLLSCLGNMYVISF